MIIDNNTLLYLTIILATFMVIYLFMESRKKPRKKEYVTKELLECTNCKYEFEQDFEPGDFIGMIKKKCPKCGAPMRIKAIYAVEKQ